MMFKLLFLITIVKQVPNYVDIFFYIVFKKINGNLSFDKIICFKICSFETVNSR